MTQTQARKLKLLERIAQMDDPKQIKKLMNFLDTEVLDTHLPSKEVLLARARAGKEDINAGNFGTERDLNAALKEAKERGLSRRAIYGKAA